MVSRQYWLKKIEQAWRQKSIIWLSGVRRSGKTLLCQSLDDVEYFDCELPRVRRQLEDPESFLSNLKNKRIILDEIHRLKSPSELLKIAADHYPKIKVLATGSSSLQASAKFKDTLTGRKINIWLTPMISQDLSDFGNTNLNHRLLHGGLPPSFLESKVPERDFQEWMDSFWAKDIQELFRLEKQHSFKKFIELILVNSGGIFEATKYATPCEVSRPTISNYLNVLENTYVAHIIKPFSTRKSTEIISAPKIYAFDSGFVCYYRGWYQLRDDDFGFLWEHFVLNEIHGQIQTRDIYYWRDKLGHEIDFLWIKRGQPPTVIECKWSATNFNYKNLKTFRNKYPEGNNYVVAQDIDRSYSKHFDKLKVDFVSLSGLIKRII